MCLQAWKSVTHRLYTYSLAWEEKARICMCVCVCEKRTTKRASFLFPESFRLPQTWLRWKIVSLPLFVLANYLRRRESGLRNIADVFLREYVAHLQIQRVTAASVFYLVNIKTIRNYTETYPGSFSRKGRKGESLESWSDIEKRRKMLVRFR